jgi:hypothetical protein
MGFRPNPQGGNEMGFLDNFKGKGKRTATKKDGFLIWIQRPLLGLERFLPLLKL